MKYVLYVLAIFIVSSCATGVGLGYVGSTTIDIDGRTFVYGTLRDQKSILYKEFMIDAALATKEFRCGGNPNSPIDYLAEGYCPYTDNGVYPRDEDLDKICKLDDPKSLLYERKGEISYSNVVKFSCIKDNITEQVFITAKSLTKGIEKNMNQFTSNLNQVSQMGISLPTETFGVFYSPLFKSIKKTRDINVNDLNIKSFSLDLPKNSTSNCNDKYEFLWFEGPVNPDTPEIIKRILDDIDICKSSKGKNIPIIITMFSGGGLLADGFRTGDILREFDTYSIIQEGEYCASSCATAFIGSKKREILGNGQIMFHAPYSYDIAALQKGEIEIECQTKNSKLENYYIQMLGEDDGTLLYDRTMSYCGQNTTWSLNSDAAKIFGITNN